MILDTMAQSPSNLFCCFHRRLGLGGCAAPVADVAHRDPIAGGSGKKLAVEVPSLRLLRRDSLSSEGHKIGIEA